MLDPTLCATAIDAISLEFEKRIPITANAVGRISQDCASRGMLNSTVPQAQVGGVLAAEFIARANLAWEIFAQVLKGSPAVNNPDLGKVLQEQISSLLETACGDLNNHHKRFENIAGLMTRMRPLIEMRSQAVKNVRAQINLWLFEARKDSALTNPLTFPALNVDKLVVTNDGVGARGATLPNSSPVQPPRAFISYAWENEPFQEWIKTWATRLRENGVDVTLDKWHAIPGDQLPAFMESSIRDNDFVLIVCTPKYKAKSDNRSGGVGYEGDIMTSELMVHRDQRKFIPILALGDWKDAAPSWLSGKYYIDLRGDPYSSDHFDDLLATLHKQRQAAPPLGPSPFAKQAASSGAKTDPISNASSPSQKLEEPIRILGIVADEVSQPRLDGTHGSALYTVPFRLSQSPSAQWAELFIREWDHPRSYTSRHRPGIARIEGDRLTLDRTTIEEIEEVHRETLQTVLRDVNARYTEVVERDRKAEQRQAQEAEDHAKRVRDAAARIQFD